MIRSVLAVAQMTFATHKRNRSLFILLVFSLLMVGAMSVFPALIPGADRKALVDMAFFLMEMMGLFAILFSVSILFYRDIENKTVLLDLTKPVSRGDYLLGKYLGTVATLLRLFFYMVVLFLLILAVNRMEFYPAYVPVLVYIFLELVLVAAIAMLFATMTTSLPGSILFTLCVYLLGQGSTLIGQFARQTQELWLKTALTFLYHLLPDLDLFNLKDKLNESFYFTSLRYSLETVLYGVVYGSAVMLIAYAFFRRRDF